MMGWFFKKSSTLEVPLTSALVSSLEETSHVNVVSQTGRGIHAISLADLRKLFVPELQAVFDVVSLPTDEVDCLIAPIVDAMMRMVHLLPASNTDHHSGAGGLLRHSLDCAISAAGLAKDLSRSEENSQEKRYLNKKRWMIAGFIVGLVHDAGKVVDVSVRIAHNPNGKTEDCYWHPDSETLEAFIKRYDVVGDDLHVMWRKDRIHKQHERRTLRLLYRYLMNRELWNYLSEVGDTRILNAIEDALTFGDGPLG